MKIQLARRGWVLLICVAVFTFTSCKKDSKPSSVIDDNQPALPGVVTGVGTPAGNITSKIIGLNGGTITSSDGLVKIDVPQGAFTSEQTVSIQPITNLNKAGKGIAYRLTPHDITFAKPVTLTFLYDETFLDNTISAAISASYQDKNGVWQAVGDVKRDTANKIVTVKTNHFSDWSLFQMLRISPWRSFVDLGGSVELRVQKMVKDLNPVGDLDVPMPDQPITDTTGVMITEWSTSGGGFTLGTGASATYFAPATMPQKNPVVITAHVAAKGNEKWMLLAFAFIGKEGINYRMDNGDWINAPVILGAIKVNDTLRTMQGVPVINNQPAGSMAFSWLAGTAGISQPWTAKFPAFQYGTGGITSYFQFKSEGNNISISPGALNFMEYEGDYVSGTFLLTRAGKLIASVPVPQWQAARFEGFFRVKWKK